MSNKAKNSQKPIFNIEQIKQALSNAAVANGDSKDGALKFGGLDFKQTSKAVQRRINALKHEQLKFTELEAQFFQELHALECKYQKLYEPMFKRRREVIVGDYEPTEEEGKWSLDEVNGHEEAATKEETTTAEAENEKGIPNFWLETLQAMRMTSDMISEADEAILAYLQDIQVQYFEQKPYGYKIDFHFAENPYFSNSVLSKTYELKIEVDNKDPFSFEGPDLERVLGTEIDWKAGKNVTVKLVKKKIKSKNKKAPPKVITHEEKQDSFFNFFETPKSSKNKANNAEENGDSNGQAVVPLAKKSEGDEDEDYDEDENEDIMMFADFELAQQIREKLVPKAVLYYTGELDDLDDEDYDEYDEDDEEGEEDDEENDEDDEDDDEDDDDDEEEDHKKGGKGGKKGGKGGNAGGKALAGGKGGKGGEPTPSECKQN